MGSNWTSQVCLFINLLFTSCPLTSSIQNIFLHGWSENRSHYYFLWGYVIQEIVFRILAYLASTQFKTRYLPNRGAFDQTYSWTRGRPWQIILICNVTACKLTERVSVVLFRIRVDHIHAIWDGSSCLLSSILTWSNHIPSIPSPHSFYFIQNSTPIAPYVAESCHIVVLMLP